MPTKDCKMEFTNGRDPHEFRSRDLDLALKWAHDANIPIKCIRTPWGTLTMMDDKTYDTAMDVFSDK